MREDKTRYSINIGQYRIFIIKEVLCIRLEPDLATDCINRLSEYMYIYIIHYTCMSRIPLQGQL